MATCSQIKVRTVTTYQTDEVEVRNCKGNQKNEGVSYLKKIYDAMIKRDIVTEVDDKLGKDIMNIFDKTQKEDM